MGAWRIPSGFTIRGTELGEKKRRSYPRVRGNGAASVTPASSSRPLLTQHTGRNWLNAETVESCEGVRCRPARSSADVCQRGAVHQRMGGGNTPYGVSPHPQGARLASTIQWANLRLETAFPFCCPPWQTKRCSELLTLRVRSTYMRNALTGHSNAKAGSASSEGSAARARETSTGGGRGCQSFHKGKARSQRNHAHTPTKGA